MTSDASTVAAISAALATYDDVPPNCPANASFLGDKSCPKCGAGRSEGCREEMRAAYDFIRATREALKASGGVE